MIDYLKNHKWSILQIIVYVFIFYFIYGATILYYNSKHITQNWSDYKCRPYIIPIAGYFKGDNFLEATVDNFNECTTNIFKKYFDILIKPIAHILTTITKALMQITNTINVFRKMATVLRELFNKIVAEIFTKIQNHVAATQFYSEKFKTIMRQQYAVFQMVYYYLEALRMSFDSFINGPTPILLIFLMMFGLLTMFLMSMCLMCPIPIVGIFACPICVMCFSPDTIIGDKLISNIKVGDFIEPNNMVLSTYDFILDVGAVLYKYGGVSVTGSHIVYVDSTPSRIISMVDAIPEKIAKRVCCLSTTTHQIKIGNLVFSDYTECNNPLVDQQINNLILSKLNGDIVEVMNYKYYPTGFVDLELLNIDTNMSKIVNSVKYNDIELYNYCGIICSGNNIILEDNIWRRVYQSNKAIHFSNPDNLYKYAYNTTTSDGIIKIGSVIFRDFMEIYDKDIWENIHNISLNHIKNSCLAI
jgi:hypothetical protein